VDLRVLTASTRTALHGRYVINPCHPTPLTKCRITVRQNVVNSSFLAQQQPALFRRARGTLVFLVWPVPSSFRRMRFVFVTEDLAEAAKQPSTTLAVAHSLDSPLDHPQSLCQTESGHLGCRVPLLRPGLTPISDPGASGILPDAPDPFSGSRTSWAKRREAPALSPAEKTKARSLLSAQIERRRHTGPTRTPASFAVRSRPKCVLRSRKIAET
jgi:hypothetical protein